MLISPSPSVCLSVLNCLKVPPQSFRKYRHYSGMADQSFYLNFGTDIHSIFYKLLAGRIWWRTASAFVTFLWMVGHNGPVTIVYTLDRALAWRRLARFFQNCLSQGLRSSKQNKSNKVLSVRWVWVPNWLVRKPAKTESVIRIQNLNTKAYFWVAKKLCHMYCA